MLEICNVNGTNFVGAEHELKKAIQQWNMSKIEQLCYMGKSNGTPSASHQGGVWERLIRSVRKILNVTQSLDEEGLHTFLCEAEAILNSYPITTPFNDPHDIEALTPNHVLLLR